MIYNINQVNKKKINIVGYKGAWLGEILQHYRINVPHGFIIGADSFDEFLEQDNFREDLNSAIEGIDIKKMDMIESASFKIRDMIHDYSVPKKLEKEIWKNFKKLKPKKVAVRGSATSTYLQAASWSGDVETLLGVDKKNLIPAIKKVWSSFYLPRPLYYRLLNNQEDVKFSIAILVQELINPYASGVAYSKHPVIHNNKHIFIEAIYGLGQGIKYNHIHPDTYLLDKNTFEIKDVHINPQEDLLTTKKQGLIFKSIKTLKQFHKKLSEPQVQEIAEITRKISDTLHFDCEVEWALSGRKIYILQIKSIS